MRVPDIWAQGRVTLIAEEFSATQEAWNQKNTYPSAPYLEYGYLSEIGSPIRVGSHFIQRYPSDTICQDKGGVVVRESALVADTHLHAGIAVHVDICDVDLYNEAAPGVSNKAMSRRIILSLRQRSGG